MKFLHCKIPKAGRCRQPETCSLYIIQIKRGSR